MQMVLFSQTSAFGTSTKSIGSPNSCNVSCFQYQKCNRRLMATHKRTTNAISPVSDLLRCTSKAKMLAPFVLAAQWINGKLCRLKSFTLIRLSLRLNNIWYSGIASIWLMGFLLKFLSYCSNCRSILFSVGCCSTRYINKWPCRVPKMTLLSARKKNVKRYQWYRWIIQLSAYTKIHTNTGHRFDLHRNRRRWIHKISVVHFSNENAGNFTNTIEPNQYPNLFCWRKSSLFAYVKKKWRWARFCDDKILYKHNWHPFQMSKWQEWTMRLTSWRKGLTVYVAYWIWVRVERLNDWYRCNPILLS